MRLLSLCAAFFSVFVLSRPVKACIHAERDYPNVVTEKTKQALVFHDGKNTHLIIETQLRSTKNLPASLAWVIPLPSLPVRYEEADPKLFEELLAWTTPAPTRSFNPLSPLAGIAGAATESDPAIKVHDVQVIGSYKIQPIEILNDDSGEALNRWLAANGFGSVPAENQRYYLKKGAVFLALKMKNLQGEAAAVKPLHIVYPADRLSVPLKFSSHSGVFDVLMYTFTTRQPDAAALSNSHLKFVASVEMTPRSKNIMQVWDAQNSIIGGKRYDKDGQVIGGMLYENKDFALFKLFENRAGYLTRFSGSDFNGVGNLVTDLPSDPFLLPDGSGEAKPFAALGRWPVLAATVALVPLLAGWLLKNNARRLKVSPDASTPPMSA